MRMKSALVLALALVVFRENTAWAQSATSTASPPMEKVTGIGGFFFRAKDPKALAVWYERNLGVTQTPTSYSQEPWRTEAGVTVFGAFKQDTKYFGRDTQQWMLNFRVRDLAAMVAQLKRAGIEVQVDPTEYPNGKFALLHDPEGNPIQLWEAKEPPKGNERKQ
jgi:glyoxylase I family protein